MKPNEDLLFPYYPTLSTRFRFQRNRNICPKALTRRPKSNELVELLCFVLEPVATIMKCWAFWPTCEKKDLMTVLYILMGFASLSQVRASLAYRPNPWLSWIHSLTTDIVCQAMLGLHPIKILFINEIDRDVLTAEFLSWKQPMLYSK